MTLAPVTTTWVKRPYTTTGQDHLAARTVNERIYATLMPGVTNVTDRARYLSFYPWLLRTVETRGLSTSAEDVRVLLRRAECLLTLVSVVHAADAGDDDGRKHDDGLVGRNTLTAVARRAIDGERVRLSDYAHDRTAGEGRYFKNKDGGLGQYYFGPMNDLGILQRDLGSGVLFGYTKDGLLLAEALAESVNGGAFFDALAADEFGVDTLRALAPFCACQCSEASSERASLRDRLLPATADAALALDARRRSTLLLWLAMAQERSTTGETLDEAVFRAACYTGALVPGTAWQVPAPLAETLAGWRSYQRGELLSVAAQALLWLTATTLGLNLGGVARNAGSLVDAVCDALGPAVAEFPATMGETMAQAGASLPHLASWDDDGHEQRLVFQILNEARGEAPSPADRVAVANSVLRLLLALVCRPAQGAGYDSGLNISAAYLADYSVNLRALDAAATNEWQSLRTDRWLRWLVERWAVQQHLTVALRKLRAQRNDTFRFRPQDEGLVYAGWTPTLTPTYSSPRFRQTMQMLHDIGLVKPGNDGGFVPTEDGQAALGVLRG